MNDTMTTEIIQTASLDQIIDRIREIRTAQRMGFEVDREELVSLLEAEDALFWD